MEKKWRLIIDGKCDGYRNMAVDEAILACYSNLKIPTLRIYGWNEPLVSIGYNQKPEDVFIEAKGASFVRRITGGSSILHDEEITYSIACSHADLDLPKNVKQSYKILCSFLKTFYEQLGLRAYFAGEVSRELLGDYSEFCFSSSQYFDIIIEGKKIGGNAQRRRKNIIFQHGSIPQKIDFLKIKQIIKNTSILEDKTFALYDLLKEVLNFKDLSFMLADSFKKTYCLDFIPGSLSLQEKTLAQELLKRKYRNSAWNRQGNSGSDLSHVVFPGPKMANIY